VRREKVKRLKGSKWMVSEGASLLSLTSPDFVPDFPNRFELFPLKDGNASVLRNRDDRAAVGNPGAVRCAQIFARCERVDR